MENVQELIKTTIESVAQGKSEEAKKALYDVSLEVFEKGKIPQEAMGLSGEMVEVIYSHAYRLYNTGRYNEAGQLFRLLIVLNPSESKYTLGLAACQHMMKEYRNAATTYALCSMIDPDSPIPFYHASDCYVKLNDKDSAIAALEVTVARSEGNPKYDQLRDRALLNIEALKQEKKE